jgi:signal peptidase I
MRLTPRTALALLALAGLARVLGSARLFPVGRFEVEGHSMEPAYHAGDRVLVNRLAYRSRPPAAGDAVVLRDPERHGRYLLKRVARRPAPTAGSREQTAEGRGANTTRPSDVWLLGDNAADSRDSRSFGAVPRSAVVGKAWIRY